jgi:hypothetical protein
MTNSVACQFKRDVDTDGNPKGDWEPGMAFEFVAQGQYGAPSVVVSSTNSGETLVIPVTRVSFAAGNPDIIKAAWVKAQAAVPANVKALAAAAAVVAAAKAQTAEAAQSAALREKAVAAAEAVYAQAKPNPVPTVVPTAVPAQVVPK